MNGKATLKFRKQGKGAQNLYVYNYDVVHCEYSFEKKVSPQGQVIGDVVSGNIEVALPVLPTDGLLEWVFDGTKIYAGEITINDAYQETLEKIQFDEARCVNFRLHYEPSNEGYDVVLLLTINAQRMTLGNVEYKTPWK